MTLRNTLAVSTVAMALLVAGCGAHYGDKELGGSLVGAGLGALAGSQVGSGKGKLAAVAVGALAGAFVGSDVGRSLDRADRLHAARGTQTALEGRPAGKTVTWRNPDSGNWGAPSPPPAPIRPLAAVPAGTTNPRST